MREPTSWADRGLLEDDPFASIFFARSLDGGRGDRWCRQLAQDIKNDPAVRKTNPMFSVWGVDN